MFNSAQKLNYMSPEEKEMRSVHAVSLGAPVTFSTQYFHRDYYLHNNYMLDYYGKYAQAWCAQEKKNW